MNQTETTEKLTEIGPMIENKETHKPKYQSKAHCATCGVMLCEHASQNHSFVPRPKGFAAIPRERVSEIASKGGKAAHAAGTAHKFTHDEAVAAGRKGGKSTTTRHGPVGARRNGRNVADI